jgi:hypothetical protein
MAVISFWGVTLCSLVKVADNPRRKEGKAIPVTGRGVP